MKEKDLQNTHQKNIVFLENLIQKEDFNWMINKKDVNISFFNSGGGTHLYLIKTCDFKKYLARINFFPGKNEWNVKKQEFDVLKLIEPIDISPKVYYYSKCDTNNLGQDIVIVEYLEGNVLEHITDEDVITLANDLYKLHKTYTSNKFGDGIPPTNDLPYKCDIYDVFANGEDKKIENYTNFNGIENIVIPYNRVTNRLGDWFNNLAVFGECSEFSLCHADLKKENILTITNGTRLIDWEGSTYDIPESDIGRLFSGCDFTTKQQELFLMTYYTDMPDKITLRKILAIKTVLDFFKIFEDYILHKRKKWDSHKMLSEILDFEDGLGELIESN